MFSELSFNDESCLLKRQVRRQVEVHGRITLATSRVGGEPKNIPPQSTKHFVGQCVDQAFGIHGGDEAKTELTGPPFAQRGVSSDLRQAGFILFMNVKPALNGFLHSRRKIGWQGSLAR